MASVIPQTVPAPVAAAETPRTLISATGLSKTYGTGANRFAALHEVSLGIPRGRTVALLGRSGSGKSTLLNLLGAVDRPTTGSIEIAGTDLAKLSDAELAFFRRRRLGFVFQSFHLLPDLTVFDNIAVPWLLDRSLTAARRKEITALLDRLGLADKARRFPDELSGGQQQRVALARAVAHRPDLLLADEPTGNLDAQSGRAILDLIVELQREFGVTVVMATHAADAAERCDDRIVLEDGRVTEATAGIEVGAVTTAAISFLGFLRKLSFGHFRRHKLEALLCLLGVALGVAVVVAIDAAVNASVESFRGAVQSLAERSTHSIFADSGTLSDEQYVELARRKLPFPMAPVIDRGVLVAAERTNATAPLVGRLLGIDPFSERSLRSFTQMQSSLDAATLRRFLTEPGQVVLVSALADRLGVKAGGAIELTIGSRRVAARVAGIVEVTGVARAQLTDLIVADLATAQELAGIIGRLDRIDVSLEHDADEAALAAALPPGLALRSTSQRAASLSELIGSYKLNLNALSLMASFVAVFIVYNSMLISVQQRVTSLGILRCLGAGRGQLAGIYVGEALVFSLVGGVVGVLGGWLLSRALVGFVATTINDLYAAVRPGPVHLGAMEFVKGLGLSTASCLVGALVPLIRASRTPPVNAFRTTARADTSGRASLWFLLLGIGLLGLSYAVYLLPIASPIVGFVMAFLVAMGFAFACPWLLRGTCKVLAAIVRPMQILPLQMAGAGVARSLGITGVAVAATMLAMSMNVGIRTMVSSFRGALGDWVGKRFAADVFVGPELLVNHKIDATLDPAVEKWVRSRPEASRLIEYRARNVPYAGKSILLTATNVNELLKAKSVPIKSIDGTGKAFDAREDALISEPLAGRTKLSVGDVIELATPAGLRRFRVYGVFFDFGSERGQLMLDRATYAADWNDDTVNSLHVRLTPASDTDKVAAAWAVELRKDYPVVANSFGHLKNEVLTVFDRTFKVTEVLTWLAGGVAFCGLAGSLLAVSLARQKDYSVLAAVGMSGRQTAGWVLAQGLILAWVSAIVAAAAGTALAYVLAYVIQYRSFGWSIPTGPQPRFWVESFVIATAAAIVATVYPVYRLRAAAPAGSLRQE